MGSDVQVVLIPFFGLQFGALVEGGEVVLHVKGQVVMAADADGLTDERCPVNLCIQTVVVVQLTNLAVREVGCCQFQHVQRLFGNDDRLKRCPCGDALVVKLLQSLDAVEWHGTARFPLLAVLPVVESERCAYLDAVAELTEQVDVLQAACAAFSEDGDVMLVAVQDFKSLTCR